MARAAVTTGTLHRAIGHLREEGRSAEMIAAALIDFLREHHLMSLAAPLLRELSAQAQEEKQHAVITVRHAVDEVPTEAMLAEIRRIFADDELRLVEDPDIARGFIARKGNNVLDYTLGTMTDRLKTTLLTANE